MRQLAIVALAACLGGWTPGAIAQSLDGAEPASDPAVASFEVDPQAGPDVAYADEPYAGPDDEPAPGRGLALLSAFLNGFAEGMADNAALEARLYGRTDAYGNPVYYPGGYGDGYYDGYGNGYYDGYGDGYRDGYDGGIGPYGY